MVYGLNTLTTLWQSSTYHAEFQLHGYHPRSDVVMFCVKHNVYGRSGDQAHCQLLSHDLCVHVVCESLHSRTNTTHIKTKKIASPSQLPLNNNSKMTTYMLLHYG